MATRGGGLGLSLADGTEPRNDYVYRADADCRWISLDHR